MKVGDLVKIKNVPEVVRVHVPDNVNVESVGIVMEWNAHDKYPGGFILWNTHRDWCVEYEEDLELVSEAR